MTINRLDITFIVSSLPHFSRGFLH